MSEGSNCQIKLSEGGKMGKNKLSKGVKLTKTVQVGKIGGENLPRGVKLDKTVRGSQKNMSEGG